MDRVIITTKAPPPEALPLGGDVYEVLPSRAIVCDAKGDPIRDAKGALTVADVIALPADAVELDKAADRAAAIKPRFDLAPSHPLYGLPARAAGMSGQGDELMGSDGEWHPVRDARDVEELIAAGIVRREAPAKPGEEEPIEDAGEVIRVR